MKRHAYLAGTRQVQEQKPPDQLLLLPQHQIMAMLAKQKQLAQQLAQHQLAQQQEQNCLTSFIAASIQQSSGSHIHFNMKNYPADLYEHVIRNLIIG